MDLDKIKKSWDTASLKPEIKDAKIESMISHEGQSAFNKVLRYELIGFVAGVICLFASFVFRYLPVILFFAVSCLLALGWQLYKIRLLKKIDMLKMSIIEISRSYIRYRRYIIYELIFSVIWTIIMLTLFAYFEYQNKWSIDTENATRSIMIFSICMAASLSIGILIVLKYFWKNLKKLGQSIKEVQAFEKEEE